MSTYHLQSLDREAYNASIETLQNDKSIGFALMARDWWDRHFSWKSQGCVVLVDAQGTHLSYVFYKTDRYKAYLTIHNIFTPYAYRRNGYAKELLRLIFEEACHHHVRRFRLVCVPQSLAFYSSLHFVYWGITSVGDYYCNLPLPANGLEGVASLIATHTNEDLIHTSFDIIYAKVADHETLLSQEQHEAFLHTLKKLGDAYRYEALLAFKSTRTP